MKKHILLALICCLFLTNQNIAKQNQRTGYVARNTGTTLITPNETAERKQLSGPFVKNQIPGEFIQSEATIMVKHHSHDRVSSPMAKNTLMTDDNATARRMVFPKRKKTTGPMAKNAPRR